MKHTAMHTLGVFILALTWSFSHQQTVTNCNYQLDVVFAIDGSNSMFQNNFDIQKQALANLVSSLNVSPQDIHVGLVLFSSIASSYPLSGDKQGLINNITALNYPDEGTRTDVAITRAHEILANGRGGNVRKLLIIITDGRATYPQQTLQAADTAKRAGITIYAVGVTDAVKMSELALIASTPQSVFYSQNFVDLHQVLVSATNEACYSVVTTPSPKGLVPECNTQLDLVIAIDGSNSMFESNFLLQKTSIANLVNNLNVGPNDIHVGLVLFSGDVTSVRLSGYKQDILRDLDSLNYPDDATRTDLAIDQAMELFRYARGGNVRQVLVIVTDGRATDGQSALQAAQRAKSNGVSIFTVGVTNAINQQELSALASTPQQVILTADFNYLQNDLVRLAAIVCEPIYTTPLTTCNYQLDLVIAIDGSNSMFESNFLLEKSSIANLVNNLNVGPNDIHVGLVLFSGDVTSVRLSGYKQDILRDIDAFQYPDDSTRTDLAIKEAEILLSSARGGSVRKLLIVLTDGRATYQQKALQAAQSAKSSGISIAVVGITNAINQRELQALASTPQQVFFSADFQSLQREVINAANEACQTIAVTTPLPPVTPRAFCNDKLDLVIAIDGSNSMFESNFNLQKSSIANLVNNLNVGPSDVHVGLVLFSGDVTSVGLSGIEPDILRDLEAFQYPDDSTRTDLAIKEASNLFQFARGGNIKKLLLIVTDGRATYPREALQAAENAKASGISIYVVGVTNAINQHELSSLASNQQVFFSESFQNLQQDLIKLSRDTCFSG